MSERDEFEACPFCGSREIDGSKAIGGIELWAYGCTSCHAMASYEESESAAKRAWNRRAARAPQAVPALTDEQILDIGYAAKIVRSAGHWPLSERLVSIAAQQPSQEPEHQHYWSYFTDTKTCRCRCGAEQAQYPLSPAAYKD